LGSRPTAITTKLVCSKPKIFFPSGKRFNLGVVKEGIIAKHTFVFENKGSKNLEIKDIKKGCGCTLATCESLIVPPGKSSAIHVSYKARPKLRPEILKVWVIGNDPVNPVSELTMKCRVHLNVFWYPTSVSFYKEKEEDLKNFEKKVKFLTDSTNKFKLGEIKTSSKRISASWEEGNKGPECIISLNPDCAEGYWTDRVNLEIIVEDEKRNIGIPVHLMIQ